MAELRQAGLPESDAEDVVQEVAVRALTERAPREPDRLLEWARDAATVHVDALGQQPAWIDLASLERRAAVNDVPFDAGRRLALDAVLRRIAVMSPVEREAVLTGLDYGTQPTLAEARHMAVRRFRARQVLARIADAFGLVAAFRLARRLVPRLTAPVATVATAAAVMVALAPMQSPTASQQNPRLTAPRTTSAVAARPASANSGARREPIDPTRLVSKSVPDSVAAADNQPVSRTVVDGPGGTRLERREEARSADDRLACVYGLGLRQVCTPDLDARQRGMPLKNLELVL